MNDWFECNQCLTIKGEHHTMKKSVSPDFPNLNLWSCHVCGNWELHEPGYQPHYFLPRQVSRVEVVMEAKTE